MRRFDAPALFDALDRQRIARKLTWDQVSREVGVATATIKRTQHGGRMEVDGMLAMVGWLGMPIDAFIREFDT